MDRPTLSLPPIPTDKHGEEPIIQKTVAYDCSGVWVTSAPPVSTPQPNHVPLPLTENASPRLLSENEERKLLESKSSGLNSSIESIQSIGDDLSFSMNAEDYVIGHAIGID